MFSISENIKSVYAQLVNDQDGVYLANPSSISSAPQSI
jgi:hypothetical protein